MRVRAHDTQPHLGPHRLPARVAGARDRHDRGRRHEDGGDHGHGDAAAENPRHRIRTAGRRTAVNAIALERIVERERQTFLTARPKGTSLGRRAAVHFAAGVPMHWMRDWPLPSPLYVRAARDAVLTDVDGHDYVDFCLGDTGAMFGHSPPSIARVIATQSAQGLTTMLPSEQVAAVGEGLAAFFGLKWWQITQTATDANRAVLRLARMITGRPRVLVFDGCYHGTVDETMAV